MTEQVVKIAALTGCENFDGERERERYVIVEFNVPLDTLKVIPETILGVT